jgi:hypothetical protein
MGLPIFACFLSSSVFRDDNVDESPRGELVNTADEIDGTNDLSYPNFINCVSLFLEEVADIKFIGDAVNTQYSQCCYDTSTGSNDEAI